MDLSDNRSKTNGNKSLKWLLRLSVAALLLFFVLKSIDLSSAIESILSANPGWVVISILIVFPLTLLLRAWRWKSIMATYGIRYSFSHTFLLFLVGYTARFVLPTGLGDGFRVIYLVEDNHPIGQSFLTVFFDKLCEWGSQVTLGLTGLVILAPFIVGEVHILGLALMICIILGLLYVFRQKAKVRFKRLLDLYIVPRITRWIPGQAKPGLSQFFHEARRITLRQVAYLAVLSILISTIDAFSVYLFALALRLSITLLNFVAIVFVLNLILNVPFFLLFSVGGVGIREGTLVILFQVVGESAEHAVAMSALILLQAGFWNLAGVLAWIRQPLHPHLLAERARALKERGTEILGKGEQPTSL